MPSIQTISFCFFVFSGRARRGQRTAALYSCYETAAMVQTYAHHSGRFFQKSPALVCVFNWFVTHEKGNE